MTKIIYVVASPRSEGRVIESSKSSEVLEFELSEVLDVVESEWERTFASLVRDSNVLREDDSDITRIQAQLVALTPMVPVRTVSLLRCWKKMDEGLVAVVDVSVSSSQELHRNSTPFGVLLEKLGKGTTRVTWVEHSTASSISDRVSWLYLHYSNNDEEHGRRYARSHIPYHSRWVKAESLFQNFMQQRTEKEAALWSPAAALASDPSALLPSF
ncbi:hypothetical protein Bca101_042183 [Brassica carinata]